MQMSKAHKDNRDDESENFFKAISEWLAIDQLWVAFFLPPKKAEVIKIDPPKKLNDSFATVRVYNELTRRFSVRSKRA